VSRIPSAIAHLLINRFQLPHVREPWLFDSQVDARVRIFFLLSSRIDILSLYIVSRLFWYATFESLAVVGMAV
jgi:hypothetical protein